MASVGRDCHFERTAIRVQFYIPAKTTSPAGDAAIDAYLAHLTVERRLASNSVDSYARDLVLLARYAAGRHTLVEALTRTDLEALVRDLMSEGR